MTNVLNSDAVGIDISSKERVVVFSKARNLVWIFYIGHHELKFLSIHHHIVVKFKKIEGYNSEYSNSNSGFRDVSLLLCFN